MTIAVYREGIEGGQIGSFTVFFLISKIAKRYCITVYSGARRRSL